MEPLISDHDVPRTMIFHDVCLCCLARNVKFVSLAKCKHTSIFGYFFKSKFQYEDSVLCYDCHHHLNKIELFRVQIQESLALLLRKQNRSDMRPKKFQTFTFSNIYKTTNISNDKILPKLVQSESNSTNANSKQPECTVLTAEIKIELSPDSNSEGVEQRELATTDAISKQLQYSDLIAEVSPHTNSKQEQYNNLTAEVSANANLEQMQYNNWTTEIKIEESADCEPDMPLSEIRTEVKSKETTQQVFSEKYMSERKSETLRARYSNSQLSTMLEFMERHREFALGKFKVAIPNQRETVNALWVTLTNLLNSDSKGSKKTPNKWKKVWADWKSKTLKSVLKKRRHAGEGQAPVKENTLTWAEQRMCAIMGQPDKEKHSKQPELDKRTSKKTKKVKNVIHSAIDRNKDNNYVKIKSKETPNVIPNNSKQVKCNDLTAEVSPDTDLEYKQHNYLTVEVSPDTSLEQAQYTNLTAKVKVEACSDVESEQEQYKCLTAAVRPDANLERAQYSHFTAEVKIEESSDIESDMPLSDIRKDISQKKTENEEAFKQNSNFSENLRKNELRVRSTCKQLATMLEFMERHRDFALGRLRVSDPDRAEELWKTLANLLNSVGGPRGKTVEKWRKVWWDWKSKTKRKVLLSQRSQKGRSPALEGRSPADLKRLELRLWALLAAADGDTTAQMPPLPEALLNPPVQTPRLPEAASNPPSTQQLESDVSDDEVVPDERSSATKKDKLKETRVRSSFQQIDTMMNFIERHGDPALWKNEGRRWTDQMWQKLTDTLNSMEGCNGTVDKWKKVWSDFKFKTKKKVALISGGGEAAPPPLTHLEQRVWAVITRPERGVGEHREVHEVTIPSQSTEGSHSWDVVLI